MWLRFWLRLLFLPSNPLALTARWWLNLPGYVPFSGSSSESASSESGTSRVGVAREAYDAGSAALAVVKQTGWSWIRGSPVLRRRVLFLIWPWLLRVPEVAALLLTGQDLPTNSYTHPQMASATAADSGPANASVTGRRGGVGRAASGSATNSHGNPDPGTRTSTGAVVGGVVLSVQSRSVHVEGGGA